MSECKQFYYDCFFAIFPSDIYSFVIHLHQNLIFFFSYEKTRFRFLLILFNTTAEPKAPKNAPLESIITQLSQNTRDVQHLLTSKTKSTTTSKHQ